MNARVFGVVFLATVSLNLAPFPECSWAWGWAALRIQQSQESKELLTLRGYSREIHSVAFGPNNQEIAMGCNDNTVKLWDAATGKLIPRLKDIPGSFIAWRTVRTAKR